MTPINAILSQSTYGLPEPHVGMAATILLWSDRHAATVTEVFKIGSKPAVAVTRDRSIVTTGSEQGGSAAYRFEADPDGRRELFAFTNDRWDHYVVNIETGHPNKAKGSCKRLCLGHRDTYRDPSL